MSHSRNSTKRLGLGVSDETELRILRIKADDMKVSDADVNQLCL